MNIVTSLILLIVCSRVQVEVNAQRAPELKLIYPSPDSPHFSQSTTFVKAKAEVAEGAVEEVQFYLDNSLLGTATNAPYNLVWRTTDRPEFPGSHGSFYATARMLDGREIITRPFIIDFVRFQLPIVDVLVRPRDGTMIAAGTDLEITAEVVVSSTRTATWPISLYFDDQVLQTNVPPMRADTPPTRFVVSNVSEGEHLMGAQYGEGWDCFCKPQRIRAVKLGLREPVLRWDGRLEFELVTAYPGRETVIESSGNLADWTVYQRLVPQTNYVRFTVPPEESKRWFRAVLPEGAGE
jgi:hypothetical protein